MKKQKERGKVRLLKQQAREREQNKTEVGKRNRAGKKPSKRTSKSTKTTKESTDPQGEADNTKDFPLDGDDFTGPFKPDPLSDKAKACAEEAYKL
ncbi:hypothetical protein PM082_000083 [Marasmius tenuissimus]|nr:hypothetical protein PM082_000083 [Marasmius tenuissimus]